MPFGKKAAEDETSFGRQCVKNWSRVQPRFCRVIVGKTIEGGLEMPGKGPGAWIRCARRATKVTQDQAPRATHLEERLAPIGTYYCGTPTAAQVVN